MSPFAPYRRKLALVIPAHNEEMVLGATINSAIGTGQLARDIYVVDDNSSDKTAQIARQLLGTENVLSVPASGKGRAIEQIVRTFKLTERYEWIHIADADGVFGKDYFGIFRKAISKTNAVAATGYIRSLPGGWISKYRVYEYTVGLQIMRRIQNWLGVITVMPGPTSAFRSSIFNSLDFAVDSLTEDFEVTLQIHRLKLGRIAYIPQAKTSTQDPKNLHDYLKQITRWYRWNFRGMQRHGIGRKFQRIDAYLAYILFEQFLLLIELVMIPILAVADHAPYLLAIAFLADLIVFFSTTIWVAALNRRGDIIEAFPLFYILRFANLWVFLKAFVEVIVLKKYQKTDRPGWETKDRRYEIVMETN
jgi:cellulose synthase/poly-beta-1,6-N-acetylglucosamine synthase-like glycosyltransferase